MTFAALSTLAHMPTITARLDSAIADPTTATDADTLLRDLLAVADTYSDIKPPSDSVEMMLEEIDYIACNLRNGVLDDVSFFDLPAFVLAQVAELHFYCKRVESLRIGMA
jgi:hypothetical protein